MAYSCLKKLIVLALLVCSVNAYAQTQNRDVPYTKELIVLVNAYFNHEVSVRARLDGLYKNAVTNIPENFNEYQVETHLARCDYYMAMSIIESFDLTRLETALDDPDAESKGQTAEMKKLKAEANKFFDKALVHADKAILLNPAKGSDAYTIYSQIVCGNCTSRPATYALANGLKITQYAKKALKIDPKNGTANYSAYSQDLYAPGTLGNPDRGRRMMLSFLSDESLVCEKFDRFNFTIGVAYSYYRQNELNLAIAWYKKCLAIYPNNNAATMMVKKIGEKLSHAD